MTHLERFEMLKNDHLSAALLELADGRIDRFYGWKSPEDKELEAERRRDIRLEAEGQKQWATKHGGAA